MIDQEAQDALRTLLDIEKELADIYWVHGGKSALNESDLERWAGEIHAIYETLYEALYEAIPNPTNLETVEID